MSQPPLPFPSPELSIPYVQGHAIRTAWEAIDNWRNEAVQWQSTQDGSAMRLPVIALTGVAGAGKSRLVAEWLTQNNGYLIGPPADDTTNTSCLTCAIDDADEWEPLPLFAEINQAIAAGRPLILTGKDRPVKWVSNARAPGAPDLLSRLQSIQVIELDAPDEDTLVSTLNYALLALGLDLPISTIRSSASKLCRRFSAVHDVAVSAVRLSPSIAAPKALLEAAIADNPRHCLTP